MNSTFELIYYMSKFLNTSEFIIMINSLNILNLSIELIIKPQALDKTFCYKLGGWSCRKGGGGGDFQDFQKIV